MPSKKLPNRVEGLFDSTRSIVKDGRAESAGVKPRPAEMPVAVATAEAPVAPPSAPQAISGWTWEVNAAGAHVFCSPEVETILGFSPQEMYGKPLTSLSSAGKSNGEQLLAEALQAALPFTDVRLQVLTKDGQPVTLKTTGYPLRDEAGRLIGYHGVTYVSTPPASLPAEEQPPQPEPPAAPPEPKMTVSEPRAVAPVQPAAVAELPVAAPEPPAAPAPLVAAPEIRAVEPAPLPSQPAMPHVWGYMDGPEGLAPVEEDVVLPEIGEVIRHGQLIQKVNEFAALEGEESQPTRSLAAPIKIQNQILGALNFFDLENAQSWSEDEVALAQTVADQLALALENARLFNETRLQQRNATHLAHATQAVAASLGERELWDMLADELIDAYRPTSVIISRWDPTASTLTPLALRGETGERELEIGATMAADDQAGDMGRVIETGRGLIRRCNPHTPGAPLAAMFHPLIYSDNVECLVEIYTTQPEGFTPEDLKLLGSILFAAASALRTVRLYDLQRQTAERLTDMDRVKSQFLANMSHELRTPLNSIIGFSRVILKGIDGPLTEQQTQDLTSIYNSGRHLLELINDILDMSKIEAGKMEMVFDEVDLHDMIKGVMSTAIGLLKDKPAVMLKEEIATPLPTVHADATRVRQVMINLMSNASKFTESGSITLRARPIEERDPRTNQMARYVQISVIDTGPGIAESDMHKLFEAFSQVDSSATRKVGGTGLGLSICRRMIELHGGRIWVESKVGQGSNFSFIVPLYQKELPPPPPSEGQSDAPAILVVEDDQGLVGLYRRYLEPHGYKVISTDKSTEALPNAAAYKPVAVLLDVIMPNQDGWQVLADLKQNDLTRPIPVIICTIVSDRERAMSMGAADYLNKPILEADLLHTLEKVLSKQPAAASLAAPA